MTSLSAGRGQTSLIKGQTSLMFGQTSASALSKGVPEFIVINGITGHLLLGFDNQPLKGFDGQYLYGVA